MRLWYQDIDGANILRRWVVFFAALAFGRGSFLTDLTSALQFVLCDQVFLGAGTRMFLVRIPSYLSDNLK